MDGGSEAGGLTVTCMLMSNTEMSYRWLLQQTTNRLELKKQIEVERHRIRGTATMPRVRIPRTPLPRHCSAADK